MFNVYRPLPTTDAEIKEFLGKVEGMIRSAPDTVRPENRCSVCGTPKPIHFTGVGFRQVGCGNVVVELSIDFACTMSPGWNERIRYFWRDGRCESDTIAHCPDCAKKAYPNA